MQSVKPETLDHQGGEVRDATVGDVRDESQQGEQPGLVVHVSLFDLWPADATVFDTGLVAAHASDQDKFLFMIEAPDSARRIGHQIYQRDSPRGTEGSDYEELVSPGLQGTVNIADTVA